MVVIHVKLRKTSIFTKKKKKLFSVFNIRTQNLCFSIIIRNGECTAKTKLFYASNIRKKEGGMYFGKLCSFV